MGIKLQEVYEPLQKASALSTWEKQNYSGAGYTDPEVDKQKLSYEPHKEGIVRAWNIACELNSFVPEYSSLQDIME